LDLESYKPPAPVSWKDANYDFFSARWHTVALALAFVLLGVTGRFSWWAYWMCGALSFAWFLKSTKRHDAIRNKKRDDMACFPFANERDWLLHKSRLEQFKLPEPCAIIQDPMSGLSKPACSVLCVAGKYLDYLLLPFLWPFSMTALCFVGLFWHEKRS
jgi:hypothetical protein